MPAKKGRTGETAIAKNGMKITIIAYRGYKDIDVQFEDGAIRRKTRYSEFKTGKIRHPSEKERLDNLSKSRVGETTIATNGMTMTLIAYRNSQDIDVQFEDGAIIRKVSYGNFKRGSISHPSEKERRDNLSKSRVGETAIASNGMKITIMAYRKSQDIDVQFEDGKVVEGVNYYDFKREVMRHPNFPMNGIGKYKTFKTQYAYTAPNGSVYFYCECQECGLKKNLTARELINLNHKCEVKGKEIKPNA